MFIFDLSGLDCIIAFPFVVWMFWAIFHDDKKKDTRQSDKHKIEEEQGLKEEIERREKIIRQCDQLLAEISEQSKKNRKAIAEMKAAQKRERIEKRRQRPYKRHSAS